MLLFLWSPTALTLIRVVSPNWPPHFTPGSLLSFSPCNQSEPLPCDSSAQNPSVVFQSESKLKFCKDVQGPMLPPSTPKGCLSDRSPFTFPHSLCSSCTGLFALPWAGQASLPQGLGTCFTCIWYISSTCFCANITFYNIL